MIPAAARNNKALIHYPFHSDGEVRYDLAPVASQNPKPYLGFVTPNAEQRPPAGYGAYSLLAFNVNGTVEWANLASRESRFKWIQVAARKNDKLMRLSSKEVKVD